MHVFKAALNLSSTFFFFFYNVEPRATTLMLQKLLSENSHVFRSLQWEFYLSRDFSKKSKGTFPKRSGYCCKPSLQDLGCYV